jgi:sialate O-acetylesterase
MIAPIIPFAIKGAIWYQGESNAGRAYQYRTLFPTMIKDWRKNWAQGDFSFFWVQLANFRGVDKDAVESNWAELREAQTMTLALPNTGEAVIIDIGEARDIHPKNKQDVGKRLALAAESVAYGQKLVFSGPRYDKMTVEGAKARIHFTHVGGGLAAPAFTDPVTPCGPTLAKRFGLEITPELRPKADVMGFAIAGADKKFVWANAKIDGKTVVVWSDQVAKPVAVRYAWSNNPICNLYNAEGLPACPFRTDQWPGTTVNNK